ncbi:E3 ubiquitin-protein ligase TRIM35-like [Labrus bergylta]|uniref:E3 ubiquitin-protein ligase TRIM35-like n=1 Tax=Labrus bergylta TaxID=56723 RepID=UPI003313AF0F
MASMPEEDLTCPICHDIFTDPVVLTCSHSFCKPCLQDWWRGSDLQQCPVCKRRSSRSDPPRNLALKNLCETFDMKRHQRADSEDLCGLHSEKLKLFCLDHQQPVCVVCLHSETHTGHRFKPVDEAAKAHKGKIQEYMKPLQDKLEIFEQVKDNCEQTEKHIKVQARCLKWQIKEHFKKIHQFLKEEEDVRIFSLMLEKEWKSQKVKMKIESLNREIAALSDTIRVTEDELRADDISFLKNYKASVNRVQQRTLLEHPQQVSGALINEAKHLGNLTHNIWNQMKDLVSYTPVILDPNTAHPELLLSKDLTGVKRADKRKRPNNPERFECLPIVLGSQAFESGTHSWCVEVGDSRSWSLGVAAKSVERKSKMKSKRWGIEFYYGKCKAISPSARPIVVSVKKKLHQIRVDLDCNRGELSFTDLRTDTHIHTFTHTCTEKMFPYIGNGGECPIEILPNVDTDDDEEDCDYDDDDIDEEEDDD